MNNYSNILAENIKKLRTKRKLSLDKTAKLTGISKSMIAQIEKGEVNPSISTIWKLANGFKVSFTELMNTQEETVEIIRQKDNTPLIDDKGRFKNYPIISFDPNKRFEAYFIEIDVDGSLNSEPHIEGAQEFITVTQGVLKVTVNNKSFTLEKGDTIRFEANVIHSYENICEDICAFHNIIYYKN